MCMALVHPKFCGCCIIFLESFFIKGNVFHIYHNIRYQHRLKALRAFLTGNRQNRQQTAKTRQKRAGSVFTACMVCAASVARKFTPFSRGKSLFPAFFPSKTVNGDAIYCVAVNVTGAAGKPVFSTFQESGSSTAGNHVANKSPDELTTRFTGDSTL